MVENLIKSGVDVNSQSEENRWTALHMVAWNGNKEIAELLLNYGASFNLRTDFDWTALHTAAFNGKFRLDCYISFDRNNFINQLKIH